MLHQTISSNCVPAVLVKVSVSIVEVRRGSRDCALFQSSRL